MCIFISHTHPKISLMKFDRRGFIRSASVLAALTMSEVEAMAAAHSIKNDGKDVSEHDDAYWKNVRSLFPLTREWTYLNNGTFGPSPYPVIDAMRTGQMDADMYGNYGAYDATMPKLAKFVGANADEIALTHNVTEGINIACWGAPLKWGDEVILTTHEHVGNAAPWMNRQKLHGIILRKYTPGATASETLDNIAALINKKTRVIATPHIPCTQGQILPVKEICQLARDKGIYSLIDGAHGAGAMPLDLHDIGCDTYASCCHKWMLGPKGTGFLYVRKGMQDTIQSYYGGGGTDDGHWNLASNPIAVGGYAPSAHRYFGGTQANGLYTGVNAAIDFIENIGQHNITKRINALGRYTQDSLLDLGHNKIEMLTPLEQRSRGAVIGFRIKGVDYQKFFNYCGENKVRIRAVPEMGLNSLRVSTHIYNNKEDVDLFVDLVKKYKV
jgi:cysteine desulfurase / selenocysteine lyase